MQRRMRRALMPATTTEARDLQLRALARQCARQYCASLECESSQSPEINETLTAEAQFALFWGQMLNRVFAFCNSFPAFATVNKIFKCFWTNI